MGESNKSLDVTSTDVKKGGEGGGVKIVTSQ